jgi:hypothetical protein
VAHNQDAQLDTQAQWDEALLILRVLRIGNNSRMPVQKRRSSLLERDSVLCLTGATLAPVPLEANVGYADSVITT